MADIVQLREIENLPFWDIASRLGLKSWERARDAYYAAKRGQPAKQRNEAAEALLPRTGGVLDDPVRPLVLPPRPESYRVKAGTREVTTALLWGDTHMGFEDEQALSIVQQIADDLQPDTLIHMGDLLDCYKLSRFDKDPDRLDGLQDEINKARLHLANMRATCPDSRFIFLEGNHEDRMRRTLWNADESASTLMRLTNVRQALTWPTLLGLADLNIEFYPYQGQSKHKLLPKFIVKHGNVVRKFSGYTAKGEWEKYGKSGGSGHVHRLGVFYHRDNTGSNVWVETGCTCRLDPEYADNPDWQQGCVFLTFEPETGAVNVCPIYIHKGMAVFNGNVYRA